MAYGASIAVVSGAKTSLKAIEKAVRDVKRIQVIETQKAGRKAFKNMFKRYVIELYADEKGKVVRIKPFSAKWGARKAKLKLRPERGQAARGIYKAVRSPKSFVKIKDGFILSLKLPNIVVKARVRLKKKPLREVRAVNDYIDHFADQKAPGLGNLAASDIKQIEAHVTKEIRKRLATLRGAVKTLADADAKAVKLELMIGKLLA